MNETAGYGLDAPGVVRNLFLAVGSVPFVIAPAGLPMVIAFAATGAFMASDSKVGKVRLTSGGAIGVDIWQAEDLAGNDARPTVQNAARGGEGARRDLHRGGSR
jgi:hypothetical protein